MARCPNCGAEVPAGNKFCDECGTKMPQGKVCPGCGATVPEEKKFCSECGYSFMAAKKAAPHGVPGMAIGDRNTIAGDIVGKREDYKISGNATFVTNEDQTKKMVKCHVCGRNITIVESVTCPGCGEYTCVNCMDTKANLCTACVSARARETETQYRQAFAKAIASGRISPDERRELEMLRVGFNMSKEQADAIERELKRPAAGQSDILGSFEKVSLERARNAVYGALVPDDEAWNTVESLYSRHPSNEDIVSLYVDALAARGGADEIRAVAKEMDIDVLGVKLADIDIDVNAGEFGDAEVKFAAVEEMWPNNLLVLAKKAFFLLRMAGVLNEPSFRQQAADIVSAFPSSSDKLANSWAVAARNAVGRAMGGADAVESDEDYCRANNLYFAIAASSAGRRKYGKGLLERGESDEGRKWLRAAAESDDDGAVKFFYDEFVKGGFPKEDAAAILKLLENAESNGSAEAMVDLGVIYANGHGGIEVDQAKANGLFLMAAEKGNARAMRNYGLRCENGTGVEKDLAAANKWYLKAAEAGDAEAMRRYGLNCENGTGMEKDLAAANKWYLKAAEAGDAVAMRYYGMNCEYGTGMEKDCATANKWYLKAAEAGDAVAMRYYGMNCEFGKGMEKDLSAANKWYLKAAEAGNADGMNKYGLCCEYGKGMEKDLPAANKWYLKAAEAGCAAGMRRYGLCCETGTGMEKDLAAANKWYLKAADKGDAVAMRYYGYNCKLGKGMEKDLAAANKWYLKASEKGDAVASFILGLGYCSSNDVDKLRQLLDAGFDPNYEASFNGYGFKKGYTLLNQAETVEIAQCLVEHGADVNAKNFEGETPVLKLNDKFNRDLLQCLADNGADFSVRANNGHCFTDDLDYVLADVDRIVDGQYTDDFIDDLRCLFTVGAVDGKYVLEWLEVDEDGDDCELANNAGLRLLETGIDPNERLSEREGGNTLLQNFIGKLSPEDDEAAIADIERFIAHGVDVNARDNNGFTALHYAAESGLSEVVKCLIKHGVDVNVQDNNKGFTALTIAYKRLNSRYFAGNHDKYQKTIRVLIEVGSNLKCPECGVDLKPGVKFCTSCGMKFKPITAEAVAAPAAPAATPVKCPKCGATLKPGAKFCTNCGTKFASPSAAPAATPTKCPQCGAPLKPGAKFCTSCGKRM